MCSRCYNENISNYILGIGGIVWENVDAVKRTGNYYLCRCRNCGHEYKTNSDGAILVVLDSSELYVLVVYSCWSE